jgi:hypothetical protein
MQTAAGLKLSLLGGGWSSEYDGIYPGAECRTGVRRLRPYGPTQIAEPRPPRPGARAKALCRGRGAGGGGPIGPGDPQWLPRKGLVWSGLRLAKVWLTSRWFASSARIASTRSRIVASGLHRRGARASALRLGGWAGGGGQDRADPDRRRAPGARPLFALPSAKPACERRAAPRVAEGRELEVPVGDADLRGRLRLPLAERPCRRPPARAASECHGDGVGCGRKKSAGGGIASGVCILTCENQIVAWEDLVGRAGGRAAHHYRWR